MSQCLYASDCDFEVDFFFFAPRNCQWCRPQLTYSISTSYFNHLSYFPEQSFQVFFPDASIIKVFIHTNMLNCPITMCWFFVIFIAYSSAWQFLQKTLFRNCFWLVLMLFKHISHWVIKHYRLCEFIWYSALCTTVILLKYFNFFFLISMNRKNLIRLRQWNKNVLRVQHHTIIWDNGKRFGKIRGRA